MIYYISIIVSWAVSSCAQQCVNIESNPKLKQKTRLANNLIGVIEPFGLMMCAKQCHYHVDCVSWNFYRPSLRCELNYETMVHKPQDVEIADKWYHGMKQDWSYLVTDGCANNKCPAAHRCHVSYENRPVCSRVACGPPPHYSGLTYTARKYYPFGSNVTYTSLGQSVTKQSTCQSNGTWTIISLPDVCPAPVIPPNMAIANPSNTWKVHSQVIFVCIAQYKASTNQLISHCNAGGVWTEVTAFCAPDWCIQSGQYSYFPNPEICYVFENWSQHFSAAYTTCAPNVMLIIDSDEKQKAVAQIMMSMLNDGNIAKNATFWIDAVRTNSSRMTSFHKGTLFDGHSKYVADYNEEGKCVYVSAINLPEMKWHFDDCKMSSHPFICEKENN